MPGGHVTVVGLGPGDPGLVTRATAHAIEAAAVRFLRTARHPSATLVPGARSFDDLYDRYDTFAEVYAAIVDTLVAAAHDHGAVLYAVPGSPRVLERTVDLLAADTRVDVDIVAAMSFLDLAWVRLGVDPVEAGVRLVDGHVFAAAAAGQAGPMLVAHCHNRRVLSDIKLAVDEPGDTEVTVVQRLGLPDELVRSVRWADLDRTVDADHLTSIYIPQLRRPVATELVRFDELVRTLRRECPWDRAQTHASLRRHLVEEAYEVLDAIDGFDPATGTGADDLEEELGDLLFQVFLHAAMAAQEGWFELADVARTVHDKLYARHPHVFGGEPVDNAEELAATWEARKVVEKGRASVMDGVATGLPALALAEKVIKKAAALDLPVEDDLVATSVDDAEVGPVLLSLVAAARRAGVDPEMALRTEARRMAERVRAIEAAAAESDTDVISLAPDVRLGLWLSFAPGAGE